MFKNTIIKKINEDDPLADISVISEAAKIIKNGGLVAFPTETVYGLGANGFNPEAVKKIFLAKGRPQDNPLILHISEFEMINQIARDLPDAAFALAKAFWPGPLTLILNKKASVPYETSSGLETVAVRFPENKTARLLIEKSETPIAAPSANLSGRPSPTRASHVEFDLSGKIDMIIDGGCCKHGIESTIADLTGDIPVILRPGSITPEMIREITGKCIVSEPHDTETPKAPGMKYTHYSPQAMVTIVTGSADAAADTINKLIQKNSGMKTGIMATEETMGMYSKNALILCAGSRSDPETIGRNLFKLLRKFDYYGIEQVYAEGLTEIGVAASVMNRLKKAAGYDIIDARCHLDGDIDTK